MMISFCINVKVPRFDHFCGWLNQGKNCEATINGAFLRSYEILYQKLLENKIIGGFCYFFLCM